MYKTGERSYFCQSDEIFFCSNLYRSVEITDLYRSLQSRKMTNKFLYRIPSYQQLLKKLQQTVAEILQQQHFINTSTNTERYHMSNFICQNEVKMVNEPLKVEKPVLECLS